MFSSKERTEDRPGSALPPTRPLAGRAGGLLLISKPSLADLLQLLKFENSTGRNRTEPDPPCSDLIPITDKPEGALGLFPGSQGLALPCLFVVVFFF